MVKVTLKVSFFAGSAALGKILTIDNLHRSMVWVLDWCFMCKRAGETVDHLLLHCEYVRELWSLWGMLGYAPFGFRAAGLLAEESFPTRPQRYLKCYSFVPNVVNLEGTDSQGF
jgi:hypothetical protein